MSRSCLDCLTRARLLELLAPRIAQIADSKAKPIRGLLARPDADLIEVTGVPEHRRASLVLEAREAARADQRRVLDGGAVCIHDESYPGALRDLPDPPHALFHTGPLDRLLRLAGASPVAIVGSRRASEYARTAAWELGRGLAAAGVTVVSGMAFGIDAACHRGALEGGGTVIAVLASGADRASPVSHRRLYGELRSAGSVISEMPWGATPWPWLFPARNRIMAALAQLTVVVEGAEKSGSLITATFAEELDRTVGAMPGIPGAWLAAGNNRLLRDGAAVIRHVGDALDELFDTSDAAHMEANVARQRIAGDETLVALLDAVETGASPDVMAERTGLPARDVRAGLARLERAGLIRRSGLGSYTARMGA